MFKHICAWCEKEISTPMDDGSSETSISHGICDICYVKMIAEKSDELEVFLNKIHKPVLVVNQFGRMISANQKGRELVGKKLDQIQGQLGGDVFDCKYASSPEGCGQTLYCDRCEIRNTVMETLTKGMRQHHLPCKLNHKSGRVLTFYISTEKKGDTILLSIDEVCES